MYPLKNPAKPEKKSSGTKNVLIIGGALITILYFQKNPEKMNNLKDKFYASMICHWDQGLELLGWKRSRILQKIKISIVFKLQQTLISSKMPIHAIQLLVACKNKISIVPPL